MAGESAGVVMHPDRVARMVGDDEPEPETEAETAKKAAHAKRKEKMHTAATTGWQLPDDGSSWYDMADAERGAAAAQRALAATRGALPLVLEEEGDGEFPAALASSSSQTPATVDGADV
ncbi:hypothetical protein B0H13DRAFT_1896522 [Mycena leptocephala]|nr:hypothetical protein B0H13DRAFT_1896522 [Mycena leptocephala]